jgi:GDP-L-fucose synthase
MLSHINVGSGVDITIAELAETVARVVGYGGRMTFDSTRPDGAPRKLLDIAKITSLGWQPKVGLESGLRTAYQDFLERQVAAESVVS